jgi:hypothetical protein
MRLYNYLYYGIYKLLRKTTHEDIADSSASTFFSLFIYIYIESFFGLIDFDPRYYSNISIRAYSLIIGIPIMVFNYLYFEKRKLYIKLEEEYKDVSKKEIRKRNIITISFMVLSIVFLILSVELK